MSAESFVGGVLRERWDDVARLYTSWSATGVQTSQRAYTPTENAEADQNAIAALRESNAATLRDRAAAALAANVAFAALANPSNAQVAAHVKILNKECSALIRLALGLLDDVTGS